MNKLLLKCRPSDSSEEEFIKAWENSTYVMEALYKVLLVMRQENEKVKKDDFDCPNHYAKLAYQAGLCAAYDTVLAMLPEGSKPT